MAKPITLEIIVKFNLWDAIKLRIAGIWNVIKKNRTGELLDVNIEEGEISEFTQPESSKDGNAPTVKESTDK